MPIWPFSDPPHLEAGPSTYLCLKKTIKLTQDSDASMSFEHIRAIEATIDPAVPDIKNPVPLKGRISWRDATSPRTIAPLPRCAPSPSTRDPRIRIKQKATPPPPSSPERSPSPINRSKFEVSYSEDNDDIDADEWCEKNSHLLESERTQEPLKASPLDDYNISDDMYIASPSPLIIEAHADLLDTCSYSSTGFSVTLLIEIKDFCPHSLSYSECENCKGKEVVHPVPETTIDSIFDV